MNKAYQANYIYRVKDYTGKLHFGKITFKSKARTFESILQEIKDLKKSLRKKYKTKSVNLLKNIIKGGHWFKA